MAQQSEAGCSVDEDVHSSVPDRAHVACGILCGDEDVVDREDELLDDQCTVHSHACGGKALRTQAIMRM